MSAPTCSTCGLCIRQIVGGRWIHDDGRYEPFEAPHAPRPAGAPADDVERDYRRRYEQRHGKR